MKVLLLLALASIAGSSLAASGVTTTTLTKSGSATTGSEGSDPVMVWFTESRVGLSVAQAAAHMAKAAYRCERPATLALLIMGVHPPHLSTRSPFRSERRSRLRHASGIPLMQAFLPTTGCRPMVTLLLRSVYKSDLRLRHLRCRIFNLGARQYTPTALYTQVARTRATLTTALAGLNGPSIRGLYA